MAEYKNYNYYTSDNFTKSEETKIKDIDLNDDTNHRECKVTIFFNTKKTFIYFLN